MRNATLLIRIVFFNEWFCLGVAQLGRAAVECDVINAT